MPLLDGIQAVIFDLDGLMVDSEPIALQVWREVLAPYRVELTAETYSRVIGLEPRRGAEIMIATFDLPMQVGELLDMYWKHRTQVMEQQIVPQPGLVELVDRFAAAGLKLAVASNSPASYVRRILSAIRMDGAIACAVGSDQVPAGKPEPDVYLAAAAGLAVDPDACLAIEDSPAGVQAAVAAGMRCVAVPNPELRQGDFNGADAMCESLDALARRVVSELRTAGPGQS